MKARIHQQSDRAAAFQRVVFSARTLLLIALSIINAGCPKDEQQPESNSNTADNLTEIENLLSNPYLSVTEEPVDSSLVNIQTYVKGSTWDGYNLYCDRQANDVRLIDMNGRLVHRWRTEGVELAEWAVLLSDGGIVLIDKFDEVIRLSVDSNVIWRVPIDAHHELTLSRDKSFFYVAARKVHDHRGLRVRFPQIATISLEGDLTPRWSGFDRLDELKRKLDTSFFLDTIIGEEDTNLSVAKKRVREKARVLAWSKGNTFDYFHLNTINLVPDTNLNDDRFRAGNLLICFRNVNQIAVMDPDSYNILWSWGEGILDGPHHPVMLPSGRILVFDNGFRRGFSRVLEFDPITEKITWEYPGDTGEKFFTKQAGCAQRLANGNTLMTVSYSGWAFEINEEEQIVWKWLNPTIVDQHRGMVYRMLRYSPGYVGRFLNLTEIPPAP